METDCNDLVLNLGKHCSSGKIFISMKQAIRLHIRCINQIDS